MIDSQKEKKLIDLHAHFLPSVDDGAQSMRESIEMARMSVASGVSTVVVTPHANQRGRFENYTTSPLQQVLKAFCYELRRNEIPLTILPGMEIYASADVVDLIHYRQLCPLAGTQYYLIEFPFQCDPIEIEYVLRDMLKHRYIPLIAHPERYICIQKQPAYLEKWRKLGCVAQMNCGSVQGQFGANCAKTASCLIENALVDVFGSDAHGTKHRTPEMRTIKAYLIENYGVAYAEKLLYENPDRLLKNEFVRE